MASALARGWGEPVAVSDPVAQRAEALVAELGGEAFATNRELADAVDVVILCHKPAQLAQVAAEIAATGTPVVSILGSVTVAAVREAYGDTPAFRVLPNLPVEVARGVFCWPSSNGDAAPSAEIKAELARIGRVVEIVDFNHAAEHLGILCHLAEPNKEKADAMFKLRRRLMRDYGDACVVRYF